MRSYFKKIVAIVLTVVTLFSAVSVTASSATVTNTEIVEYARTFEGVRYVLGGHSPSGFDCSGFVNYVFSQKGIKLNNDSEWYKTVSNYGVEVTAEEALPGDIVVWAGHVGIYLGDGWCISALSGDTMKVTVHTIASFTGGSVKLYGRPNGVDYGLGGYYHVTSDEYNATLTYDNGVLTATMIDPDLKEYYTINLPETELHHVDHYWELRFTDEINNFAVGTGHSRHGTEELKKTVSIYEMDSYYGIQTEDNKWSHRISTGADKVELKIEGTKLIWTFRILGDGIYNPYFDEFKAENIKITGVYIYHRDQNNNSTLNSEPKNLWDTIISFFDNIWNFIKKPFEILLRLFA